MHKIGLISDTHDNRELMQKAVTVLVDTEKVDWLWHLGDSWTDVMQISAELDIPVRGVPGTFCPEYTDGSVPTRLVEVVDELTFMLVHDIGDLDEAAKAAANVILYGHTHQFKIYPSSGKIYVNPGHLKEESDHGRTPSFAVVTVDGYKFTCTIQDLGGDVIARASYLIDTGSGE